DRRARSTGHAEDGQIAVVGLWPSQGLAHVPAFARPDASPLARADRAPLMPSASALQIVLVLDPLHSDCAAPTASARYPVVPQIRALEQRGDRRTCRRGARGGRLAPRGLERRGQESAALAARERLLPEQCGPRLRARSGGALDVGPQAERGVAMEDQRAVVDRLELQLVLRGPQGAGVGAGIGPTRARALEEEGEEQATDGVIAPIRRRGARLRARRGEA